MTSPPMAIIIIVYRYIYICDLLFFFRRSPRAHILSLSAWKSTFIMHPQPQYRSAASVVKRAFVIPMPPSDVLVLFYFIFISLLSFIVVHLPPPPPFFWVIKRKSAVAPKYLIDESRYVTMLSCANAGERDSYNRDEAQCVRLTRWIKFIARGLYCASVSQQKKNSEILWLNEILLVSLFSACVYIYFKNYAWWVFVFILVFFFYVCWWYIAFINWSLHCDKLLGRTYLARVCE